MNNKIKVTIQTKFYGHFQGVAHEKYREEDFEVETSLDSKVQWLMYEFAELHPSTPPAYREFEGGYSFYICKATLHLKGHMESLYPDAKLSDCGIENGAVLTASNLVLENSRVIECITNNIVFSMHQYKHSGKSFKTAGALKEALSKFVGLSCTSLSLKYKGKDEFVGLKDDSIVPLIAIYAKFDGDMIMEHNPYHTYIYRTPDGTFLAESKEHSKYRITEEEKTEERRATWQIISPEAINHISPGLSLEAACREASSARAKKDEAKPENRESFTHSREEMARKLRYDKAISLFKPCVLTGSATYLCVETASYYLSAHIARKAFSSIMLGTLGSGIVSGLIGVGVNYLYEEYKASHQDFGHTR